MAVAVASVTTIVTHHPCVHQCPCLIIRSWCRCVRVRVLATAVVVLAATVVAVFAVVVPTQRRVLRLHRRAAAAVGVAGVVAGVGGRAVRRPTSLLPRKVLCPSVGRIAQYLEYDSPMVAPIRVRLRLCISLLREHQLLRHVATRGSASACRVCRSPHDDETVEHVMMQCKALDEQRAAAVSALRADGLELGMWAFAGKTLRGRAGRASTSWRGSDGPAPARHAEANA